MPILAWDRECQDWHPDLRAPLARSTMLQRLSLPCVALGLILVGWLVPVPDAPTAQKDTASVKDMGDYLLIETDQLEAKINKKGYVSGVAQKSFLDKKTGARDAGF